MNEIIIFDNQNIKLEVNMKDETVWLSVSQMVELFERDQSVISRHIRNIFNEGELEKESNMQKMHITNSDKPVIFYNLDVIISVGYRVKSKNGIIFRKWANNVLKDYLIKGYALNNKRLEYLEKTVKLIDIASRIDNNDAKDIIKVINRYSNALGLLDDYDHKTVNKPKGTINNNRIKYTECIKLVNDLKNEFNSKLFGMERDKGLDSIIKNIYQSYNNMDLYNSIEEKAANFLYLIVKDHTFIDGNKRIAAMLFIYFLNYYNILYKDNRQVIDNNTLVSITLLIAESNPIEKDVIIDLVMNFLVG